MNGLTPATDGFDKLLKGLKDMPEATAQEALKTLVARETLRVDAQRDERAHALKKQGLWFGCLLSFSMLIAAVVVGLGGNTTLAIVMCGPSLVALAGIFVIQTYNAAQTRAVAQTTTQALTATTGPP
ncbi:hypothetical protein [Streptomyces mirabilis]|uniref:hypothetical protein n=1 Tax=Streptomyces mirabilis TaxID=68239 RepID=UPI00332E99CF